MNSNNMCFDTNTLISYLFFVEPKYTVINNFIRNSKDNFFITKHITNECDKVVKSKTHLFKRIMKDIMLLLDDYQDELFTETKFTSLFLKSQNQYYYRNKIVKNKEIEHIIHKFWNKYCSENMDGFTLLNLVNKLNLSITYIVDEHKNDLYSKFYLINNHIHKYAEITDVLIKNNSHRADNEIILDLYEYHIHHNIIFVFITFDLKFYNSLIASNFSFIKKVYNSHDLETLTNS